MAIRGLWLISHEKGGCGTVKFSRRYPTVEKRAKIFNGESYIHLPEDDLFLTALFTELGLTEPDKNFVECRDSCSRIDKTSVYSLPVGDGNLWPVLAIPNNNLIYACVPLVEQSLNPLPPLITISGISEAFTLLAGLLEFVNSGQKTEAELCARVAQLPVLLTQACPLGTPTDSNLHGLLDSHAGVSGSQTQKQPAWKTSKYKGKAQVKVSVSEKVTCMQYDRGDTTDMWQVHGTVSCKCDLEGVMPHVTVSLNLPANGSPLQDILVHPCVTSLDSAVLTSSSVDLADDSAFSGPYKFPFTPPLDWFSLCYYTSQVPVPPILGFYQLQEEELKLKVTVNLKLHESVKNGFEYCEAHIPFFNRGSIAHFEHKLSFGQLEVLREKGSLVWIIGESEVSKISGDFSYWHCDFWFSEPSSTAM
ncbi:AP-5 complex subunit mu-1 isoform X2 [Rhinatrema bivittatum]|uniref:AP-5 complex subunit mu-1 isoform X2 n=1 Tax=Rhinatrema bivittatum TaxID=194408 RepID=UPI001125D02B|nr:AP-5 complex subunit mu-1 isoform X2 [Rhinatrema bivittatum]